MGTERDPRERDCAGLLSFASRRRRHRDGRAGDQGDEPDSARWRARRTQRRRGVPRRRRVQLHYRSDDRRRRRPDDRVSGQSPYAARPWLKHYDYWVRPHATYPGRPLTDILATTAVEMPDRAATSFFG